MSITEIIAVAKKKEKDISIAFNSVTSLSKIFLIDEVFAKEAGELYADQKKKTKNISYGDIFVLLTAKRLNAKIVTKDPDFKGMKNVIFIGKN